MRISGLLTVWSLGAAIVSCAFLTVPQAAAGPYAQTDLVSDLPGLAVLTEPELKNSWGVSHSSTSPFWTSNQGTSTTTLFMVTGQSQVTKVLAVNPPTGNIAIPTTAAGPQGPTGQVSNTNTSSFPVGGNGGNGGSAHFIFANLNGTISAWDIGPTTIIQATTPGAVYTGLAINGSQTMLYAANDAGAGSIDVFNSTFSNISSGKFVDPNLPAGFVPFNVQDINGKVYVAYAPAGRPNQTGAALGMGIIDIYDENGNFLQRLISGGELAAPWGLALAPAGFGVFGGDLLVGNFSFLHSEINAFDPLTGTFEGTIPVDPGLGNSPGGLWALIFGNGVSGGDPNTLYIADGINGEVDGLFAAISPVPEPSTVMLLCTAFAGLIGFSHRRHRSV